MIVAVPAFLAVALPFCLIESTAGLEEDHLTLLALRPFPFTLKVVVFLTFKEVVFFENLRLAFFTFIFLVMSNVSPLAVMLAVIVAVPAFFAVTVPV